MVVLNGRTVGGGTHYVVAYGSTTAVAPSYRMFRSASTPVAQSGVSLVRSMDESQTLVEVFEMQGVIAGATYTIRIDNGSTLDTHLYVYRDNLTASNAAGASWKSEAVGLGADESVTFVAPSSGSYAVVARWNAGSAGSYTLQITNETPLPFIFSSGFEASEAP
jgi:hypothetical protein